MNCVANGSKKLHSYNRFPLVIKDIADERIEEMLIRINVLRQKKIVTIYSR